MNDEIIYGINPVMEALRGKRRVFELFARKEGGKRLEEVISLATAQGVPVRFREKNDLARISATEHHQGVVLRVEEFAYADLRDLLSLCRESDHPGLILVLDGIQDPHNLGALIRSAACAGAHGVVIPKDRAVAVTPAAEKASAGSAGRIPVARVSNIAQALEELKKEGFWVYGAAGEAGVSVFRQAFPGPTVFVVGNEGEGLRRLVREKCDLLVSIPMAPGANSLNASVSGAILLFETVRQRLHGAPGK
jgi:23S rRNA (guanosine2251-2'-O)-methyltransferase